MREWVLAIQLVGATVVVLNGSREMLLAQTARPAAFSAFAATTDRTGRAVADEVQIVIDRWSTVEERRQLVSALSQAGAIRQFSALQKLRSVGYVRTPDSIRYEVHYAQQLADGDGGRRVFVATDRAIGFWGPAEGQASNYPFTFIELHLGHNGPEEGRMSLATRVTVDRTHRVLQLENYSEQPITLQNVQERTK